jgi:hypothetical protein
MASWIAQTVARSHRPNLAKTLRGLSALDYWINIASKFARRFPPPWSVAIIHQANRAEGTD